MNSNIAIKKLIYDKVYRHWEMRIPQTNVAGKKYLEIWFSGERNDQKKIEKSALPLLNELMEYLKANDASIREKISDDCYEKVHANLKAGFTNMSKEDFRNSLYLSLVCLQTADDLKYKCSEEGLAKVVSIGSRELYIRVDYSAVNSKWFMFSIRLDQDNQFEIYDIGVFH